MSIKQCDEQQRKAARTATRLNELAAYNIRLTVTYKTMKQIRNKEKEEKTIPIIIIIIIIIILIIKRRATTAKHSKLSI